LVIETEVKQPSSLSPSHSINDDEEKTVLKDNERTTRSYQAAQEAKATTTRPRKQRKEKEGVKVESVKGGFFEEIIYIHFMLTKFFGTILLYTFLLSYTETRTNRCIITFFKLYLLEIFHVLNYNGLISKTLKFNV
jgi:hypothetical protein